MKQAIQKAMWGGYEIKPFNGFLVDKGIRFSEVSKGATRRVKKLVKDNPYFEEK